MGYRVQYMLRAGHAFKELHINKTRLAKTQKLAKIGTWQIDLKTHDFHCSPEACETQKAIAKAGVADCGIVMVQAYQGLIRGLFGKEMGVFVEHTKNLSQGDDCCEVIITRKTH